MLIRDVIEATAMAGEVRTTDLLADDRARRLVRLRHLGMLVSGRVTSKSWTVIAQAWGGRDRSATEKASLKAEALLNDGDAETVELLRRILGFLGLSALPPRPDSAFYQISIETIDRRISLTQARLQRLNDMRTIAVRRDQAEAQEARV